MLKISVGEFDVKYLYKKAGLRTYEHPGREILTATFSFLIFLDPNQCAL